jgi:hypothetical protein
MTLRGQDKILTEWSVLVLLCGLGLAWDRIRTAALRGRRLTARHCNVKRWRAHSELCTADVALSVTGQYISYRTVHVCTGGDSEHIAMICVSSVTTTAKRNNKTEGCRLRANTICQHLAMQEEATGQSDRSSPRHFLKSTVLKEWNYQFLVTPYMGPCHDSGG